MRTNLIFLTLVSITFFLFSCQKEVNELDPTQPPPAASDSAWFISSIRSANYDSLGDLTDSTEEYYTYQDGKTTCKIVEHYIMFPSEDSVQYSFHYGPDKRLNKFTYDFTTLTGYVKTILFTYTGTGNNSVQADVTWDDNTVQRDHISYSAATKTTTVNDTIPLVAGYRNKHIIYHATDGHVDSTKSVTTTPIPGEKYTYIERFGYDAQKNLVSYTSADVDDPPANDSIIILSHESKGAEIENTFQRVYSNMRWYPLILDETFYSITSPFAYINYPMISGKRWSRDINMDLTVYNIPLLFTGTVQNTFDSNNLLIKQELPAGFANKYGGRATFRFTYIKLPK